MSRTTLHWVNFRENLGFVTDGANQQPLLGTGSDVTPYPVTLTYAAPVSASFDAGAAVQADGARDRNAAVDPRLAGTWKADGGTKTIRINLDATGIWELRAAFGSAAAESTAPLIRIYDDATLLATIDKRGASAAILEFYDITGVKRTSAADWVSNNAAQQFTFASNILYIELDGSTTVSAVQTLGMRYIGASGPNIVSVDDMTPEEGTTLVVTGTALKASGNSTATIGGVSQTITTQSATVPELTVTLGTLKFGTTYNLVITDSAAAASNSFALTSLQPAAGNGFVNVGTPNANTAVRLTSIADAVSGDQIEWENVALVTIYDDLTWDADDSVTTIRARIWTAGDGYGPWTTQTINGASPGGANSATGGRLIRPFNKRVGLGF